MVTSEAEHPSEAFLAGESERSCGEKAISSSTPLQQPHSLKNQNQLKVQSERFSLFE
jgi:hypothetical protein